MDALLYGFHTEVMTIKAGIVLCIALAEKLMVKYLYRYWALSFYTLMKIAGKTE